MDLSSREGSAWESWRDEGLRFLDQRKYQDPIGIIEKVPAHDRHELALHWYERCDRIKSPQYCVSSSLKKKEFACIVN
jgi:hypothetical protein